MPVPVSGLIIGVIQSGSRTGEPAIGTFCQSGRFPGGHIKPFSLDVLKGVWDDQLGFSL
jgi:hypothetical protein